MNSLSEARHSEAQALFQSGQLDKALAAYQELCQLDNNDAQAWHMSGAIAGMTGNYELALQCCETVIGLQPDNFQPYLNLANVLVAMGRPDEAGERYQQALERAPGDTRVLVNLANLHIGQGRLDEAATCLDTVLASSADSPDALNSLGNLHRERGQFAEAESAYRKALSASPEYAEALCNLGAVLSDQLKFSEAEACYARVLQANPGHAGALRSLGNLYQSMGEYDKARAAYENVIQQQPADMGVLSSLAVLLERCNEKQAAMDVVAPLVSTGRYDVDTAITYAKLCSSDGRNFEGIQLLEAMLQGQAVPGREIDLRFTLGDLYDRSGDYGKAFAQYSAANDMDKRRHAGQAPGAGIGAIAEYFTGDRLASLPQSNCESEMPVFIVGMPRTGTSLVEQILSSHPSVCAGGERGDMFTLIDSISASGTYGQRYPDLLENMAAADLDRVAAHHMETIRESCSGGTRFTDKTPLHGLHLGFINRVFPNSRIIVCHRNPLDTCLSIYFNRFNSFHEYAMDLEAVGRFSSLFYELMDHWDKVLGHRMMSVQYEALVDEPGKHIRRMIDFCGLQWDERCMRFYENRRTVNTPSYDQVRQPIYRASVDRWKHYDRYLGPLRTGLGR